MKETNQTQDGIQSVTPVTSTLGDGRLTWTLLSVRPVQLTVRVSDKSSSSLFTSSLLVCNCQNGGTCQYDSVVENHLRGRFQVRHIYQTICDIPCISSGALLLVLVLC